MTQICKSKNKKENKNSSNGMGIIFNLVAMTRGVKASVGFWLGCNWHLLTREDLGCSSLTAVNKGLRPDALPAALEGAFSPQFVQVWVGLRLLLNTLAWCKICNI